MAGSPQVPQGNVNRLKASIIVVDSPELNVTAPFLGREGISIAFEGPTAATLPTLTGTVQSPEPFQIAHVTLHLLKTQALADTYKRRLESNVVIGDVTVTPDTVTLSNYNLNNCTIAGVRDLPFNGVSPEFAVTISGYYPINADIWNAA